MLLTQRRQAAKKDNLNLKTLATLREAKLFSRRYESPPQHYGLPQKGY